VNPIYPVIPIDAIAMKIRSGQVGNRPVSVVMGITLEGSATSWACGWPDRR